MYNKLLTCDSPGSLLIPITARGTLSYIFILCRGFALCDRSGRLS